MNKSKQINNTKKVVSFTSMEHGTAEDYRYLDQLEDQYKADLPRRLINALEQLEHSLSGYKVSRLEHVLQAATRAHRAGESEEWVMGCTILVMTWRRILIVRWRPLYCDHLSVTRSIGW